MRRFTEEEKAAIAKYYPEGGTALCIEKCKSLNDFEIMGIAHKAFRMGLKVSQPAKSEINRKAGAQRRSYSRSAPVMTVDNAPSGWGYVRG